jgi:hypothetical protein
MAKTSRTVISGERIVREIMKKESLPASAAPFVRQQVGGYLAIELAKAGLGAGSSNASAGGSADGGAGAGRGNPPQPGINDTTAGSTGAPSNPVVSDMRSRFSQSLLIPTNDVDPTTSLAWSASPLEPAYQRALNMHPLNVVAQSYITPSPTGNLGVGDGAAGGNLGPASAAGMNVDRRDYGRQPSTPPSATSAGSTSYNAVRSRSAGGAMGKSMDKATRDIQKALVAMSKRRRV